MLNNTSLLMNIHTFLTTTLSMNNVSIACYQGINVWPNKRLEKSPWSHINHPFTIIWSAYALFDTNVIGKLTLTCQSGSEQKSGRGSRWCSQRGVGLPHRKNRFCMIFRDLVISLQEIDILSTNTIVLASNLKQIIDLACKSHSQ